MAESIVTIPVGNDLPFYSFQITLSQVVYLFTLHFDGRMQRWVLDIADTQRTPILSGIPLLFGRSLVGRFVKANLPVGTLFVTDDTNSGAQPTRNSFGTTHTFWYLDPTGTT